MQPNQNGNNKKRQHYWQFSSDIPTHNKYIKKENLKSQTNLSLINQWTKAKKMRLNMKKT